MAQSEPTSAPFRADPEDELPVGVQLGWQLRSLIAAGRLAAGERMPSVRALASWADVNVNTVRAVYARLEDEGLIVTSHGRGSYVADGAGGSSDVERIAGEAIAAARAAGVDPRDVAITTLVSASLPEGFEDSIPTPPVEDDELDLESIAAELELGDPGATADEPVARRELRRQIAKLEGELAAYGPVPSATVPARSPEPRIAGVAELAATRDRLLHRLAEARAAAVRQATRERRAREVRDAMVADPAGHRWEIVSAADTGEPGCTTWQVGPRMGPLGALMNWWRVRVSGGCP